nr:cell division protein DamX [Raoultella sp. NCTC 9187]
MMGVGILVLLLLIVGIGSALKSPSSSNEQAATGEKSINLSDAQDNSAQPATQDQTAGNAQQQDVSLPPIASNPTQGQTTAEPQGQQRVEVQGDLNNALTQQQGQIDSAVASSTLPTEPATVAPMRNGTAPRQATTERQTQTAAAPPHRVRPSVSTPLLSRSRWLPRKHRLSRSRHSRSVLKALPLRHR